MNRVRWAALCMPVWLLLWAIACGTPVDPQQAPLWGDEPVEPLDLRAAISAEELPLLQDLQLTVDLYTATGVEAEFEPAVPAGFVGEVEGEPAVPLAKGDWLRWRLHLRPTSVGTCEIPPFKAQVGEDGPVATSRGFEVVVTTALDGAGDEVEAPAPPFPPRPSIWPFVVGGLAAIVLLAAVWWWRRRTRRKLQQVDATPPPAHVTALRALARLRHAPRTTATEVEAFYVSVSQVLRDYLEERFALHAPERTTEEFLAEVEGSSMLSPEHRSGLAQFLHQCDLVKFARVLPDEVVHNETFAIAESFVETTRADRVREGAVG